MCTISSRFVQWTKVCETYLKQKMEKKKNVNLPTVQEGSSEMLQNPNIVTSIIKQEVDDDDEIDDGSNVVTPSLSINISTAGKTIFSPPANSFVSSLPSNFATSSSFVLPPLPPHSGYSPDFCF
jgi:hypothetical protein